MYVSEKLKNITLCFFVIYIINTLMEITAFQAMSDVVVTIVTTLRFLCYFVFVLKVIFDVINEKKISLSVILLVVLAATVVLCTNHIRFGAVVLVLVAMRNINADKAIKCIMFAVSVFYAVVVLLSLVGIIPDWQHTRNGTVRHALGFHYPTDTYSIYLSIVLMYIYSYRKFLNYAVLTSLAIANFVLYYLTDGRLSFVLVSFALLFAFCYKFINRFKRVTVLLKKLISKQFVKWFVIITPVIFTILAFALILIYNSNNGVGDKLNSILSDRLLYASNALENYPVRFFGAEVEWVGWGSLNFIDDGAEFVYNYVDISYIRMLFDYGIVASLLILLLYVLLVRDLYNNKNYVTLFIILVVLIWSFVEPYIFSINRNIFVLLFVPYLCRCNIDITSLTKKSRFLKP